METNSDHDELGYTISEEEVKKTVQSQAASFPSYNSIKEKLRSEFGSREPTREEVVAYVKRLNLADDVLKDISEAKTPSNSSKANISQSASKPALTDNILSIKILQGRNFKDYKSNSSDKMLVCDVTFQDQRFISKPMQGSENPIFNQTFSFKLNAVEGDTNLESYVANYAPLHFVIVEEDKKSKKRHLVGVKRIDWRHVLHEKSIEQEAVFNNIDIQKKVPLGILTVTSISEQ
eukprot:TRINITY_DN2119_c0_g1_i1.p2 TRINITY_DN2119_c0_g1~~TRINITY_DN2119_c0_g1_i1.p2  ORF type:complete len:234 (-),score=49.97 TRINITY_DN2119_c0_g1_i1:2233-2934(-)